MGIGRQGAERSREEQGVAERERERERGGRRGRDVAGTSSCTASTP